MTTFTQSELAKRAIGFRRPYSPDPIERFRISHPSLPAALDSLRILHLSDLHIRRYQPLRADLCRLEAALAVTECDMIALTGDCMNDPGQERAAFRTLNRLVDQCGPPPRLGRFAIFGNHDSPEFRRAAAKEVSGFEWIGGRAIELAASPGCTLRLLGLDEPEDLLALTLGHVRKPTTQLPGDGAFTIALAHYPSAIIPAAELRIPLVLAGHTHAGQVRVSSRLAPHTSSDVPMHLAAGCLRLGSTLCCVSRGLGDGVVDRLRFNCPRQAPLYELVRAPLSNPPPGHTPATVTQVIAW